MSRVTLEVPPAMYDTLLQRAEQNDRSMNQEIRHIIRLALEADLPEQEQQ